MKPAETATVNAILQALTSCRSFELAVIIDAVEAIRSGLLDQEHHGTQGDTVSLDNLKDEIDAPNPQQPTAQVALVATRR